MKLVGAAVVLALLGCVCSAQKKSYHGYHVLRASPESEAHAQVLKHLKDELGSRMDLWNEHASASGHVTFSLEPEVVADVTSRLREAGIPYAVNTDNLQQWIDAEHPPASQTRASDTRANRFFSFERYNHIDSITDYLESLVSTCRVCRVMDIGTSYEGRPLKVVKVSIRQGRHKKAVFMDGGIHAREWISPATVLYLMNTFITRNREPWIRELLWKFDFFFMPVANPDGYAYSHDHDRMWRKTRSPNNGSACMGADPNRNFAFHWGESGVSPNPCADNYPGSSPMSEPEVRALGDFLLRKDINFRVYLAIHSYGQFILAPWGYARQRTKDFDHLYSAMDAAREAMYSYNRTNPTEYAIGNSAIMLNYEAAGASDDYAKGVAGIKYSYTVELQPQDSGIGFLLPASHIRPQGEEMMRGLAAMLAWVRDNDF